MRVTLTVIGGPHTGQAFSFAGHDTFLVGRSTRAHFRLPSKDRFFSRVHFLVEVNPPQCRLMDMGSRNGTYVNRKRVEDPIDLKDKDQIRDGRTCLRLNVEATTEVEHPPEPEPIPAPPIPPPEPVPVPKAIPVAEAVPVLEEPLAVLPIEDEELLAVSLPEIDPDAEGFVAEIAAEIPAVDVLPAVCRLCEGPLSAEPPLLPDAPSLTCRACQELISIQDQFIE